MRDAWYALCVRAGLGRWEGDGNKKKYIGLTPHDLRRSAAKNARRKGIPESVIMKLGGWRSAQIFRRYAIVSEADQLAAVAALEQPAPPAAPQERVQERPVLKLQ